MQELIGEKNVAFDATAHMDTGLILTMRIRPRQFGFGDGECFDAFRDGFLVLPTLQSMCDWLFSLLLCLSVDWWPL